MDRHIREGEIWRPGPDAEPPEGYGVFLCTRNGHEWWAFTAPGEKSSSTKALLTDFPPDRRGQTREAVITAAWTHFGALPDGVKVTMVGSTNAWVLAHGKTKVVRLADMRAGWVRVAEAR